MSDVIEKLTEGDVYRWSYRNPNANHGIYGGYHCCSRIAVFTNGLLRDTYWGLRSGDGCWFGPDALPALDLKFVGNFSDLQPAKEYEADYYDDTDIVDLNHANSSSGNFYLRKGSKRSQAKMLATARERFAQAEDDFHTARRRMDEVAALIDRIQAGADVPFIPSWR